MDVAAFLDEYLVTILFYVGVIGVIFLFRNKLEWQAKFVGLYKTKIGIKLMERIAYGRDEQRVALGQIMLRVLFPVIIILFTAANLPLGEAQEPLMWAFIVAFLAYCTVLIIYRPIEEAGVHGIIIGFLGMIVIVGFLGKGLLDLLLQTEAPPVVTPVLPGISIPGLGIKMPLVIGWLALFVVIVIHEFSHGVVSKAFKIPVRSSGLLVFGPIGGAFVEPDEEKLKRAPKRVQLAIFAAGPYSNVLTGILFMFLIGITLLGLSGLVAQDGIVFESVQPGLPAAEAGVTPGFVYDSFNGEPISTREDFLSATTALDPGDIVTLRSTESGVRHEFALTENPTNPDQGYLGVIIGTNLKWPGLAWLYAVLNTLFSFIFWAHVLSLGIGLANLLPIGPFDGGRMFKLAGEHFFGEKRGTTIWTRTSLLLALVLLVLLVAGIASSFV